MLTLLPFLCLMFAAQNNVLHRPPLEYPPAAVEKGIQGSVVLEVNLNADGLVTDARVVSGPPELRNSALRNVLDWHFSKQMGLPATTEVTVDFKLQDGLPLGPEFRLERAKAAIEPQVVQKIKIQGLTAPARDALLAKLAIREGETIDADRFAAIETEVRAFDEHLHVMLIPGQNGATLEISHRPAPRAFLNLASTQAIPVGGNAQQAKLVRQARPMYPPEAKSAGIQGLVRMSATIAKDGTVKNLDVVAGPAALVPAALEAVRQWVYQPTLLNGEPVEVITTIDVNFTLSR